jgi:F0F1-type ATP synthase gamma subunit
MGSPVVLEQAKLSEETHRAVPVRAANENNHHLIHTLSLRLNPLPEQDEEQN